LVDSVADKVMAIVEIHGERPSTRFRDLVDLVLIARHRSISAPELLRALNSERTRRRLPDVRELCVPDAALWRKGYAGIAGDVPGLPEKDLDSGLALAKAFVDPVLSGSLRRGSWDPLELAWQGNAGPPGPGITRPGTTDPAARGSIRAPTTTDARR
jgi:hypothetical protein